MEVDRLLKESLVDLFYYCCQLDPKNRPTCNHILGHKAFDSIKP